MQKTKAQIKWESDHDIVEQLEIIKSWTDYEDAGVFDKLKSVEDLIKLYRFLHFNMDVDFKSDVLELIDNEDEQGKKAMLKKLDKFNKELGYEIFQF